MRKEMCLPTMMVSSSNLSDYSIVCNILSPRCWFSIRIEISEFCPVTTGADFSYIFVHFFKHELAKKWPQNVAQPIYCQS
jgi:hypothetical protein